MVTIILLILASWPPRVFLWDNDGGERFYDSEAQEWVGYEAYIFQSLLDNGCQVNMDTLLPDISSLQNYDALFVVNGTRDTDLLDATEMAIIQDYMELGGKCVYMEGNNITEFLSINGINLLNLFGATIGNPSPVQYIRRVEGMNSTFSQGETFNYTSDDYISQGADEVLPAADSAFTFQLFSDSSKAYWGAGVGYGFGTRKAIGHRSLITSVDFGGLQSDDTIPSTLRRDEFMKKILGFLGLTKVLVVDGARDGENVFQEDLSNLGFSSDLFPAADTGGPSFDFMKNYSVVIWRTSYSVPPFISSLDTAKIKKYLDYGGTFLLTGENIGSAIGVSGQGDVGFLLDYFGCDFIGDSVNATIVNGIGIYNGISSSLSSQTPDELDGDTAFIYRSSKDGEVGGVTNSRIRSRTLFMGFRYCDMDTNSRKETLGRSLNSFGVNSNPSPPTGLKGDEKKETSKSTLFIVKKEEIPEGKLYTLDGRRISSPQSGIFILKTKKKIYKVILLR